MSSSYWNSLGKECLSDWDFQSVFMLVNETIVFMFSLVFASIPSSTQKNPQNFLFYKTGRTLSGKCAITTFITKVHTSL